MRVGAHGGILASETLSLPCEDAVRRQKGPHQTLNPVELAFGL